VQRRFKIRWNLSKKTLLTIPTRFDYSTTLMNTLETIEELTTEWVNANEDKIRFAAWVRSLTEEQTKSYVRKFSRCEDAPCCGCCD
jgi:hypothetical protein